MTLLLGWAATIAVTAAAVLFGQSAKQVTESYPIGAVPVRIRTGIAVSITGPVLALLIGVLLGAVSGEWALAAAMTVGVVAATAIAGLVLSPQ